MEMRTRVVLGVLGLIIGALVLVAALHAAQVEEELRRLVAEWGDLGAG